MLVAALDGRTIEVRRRWFPWKPRLRRVDPAWVDMMDGADDPLSAIVLLLLGLVVGVVLAIVLTVAILASEVLLILLVLVPLIALARIAWLLPWKIEAAYAETILGVVGVRGWRASEERIRDLAAAYQRGEDPFEAMSHPTA